MTSDVGNAEAGGLGMNLSSNTIGKDFEEDVRPLINIVDKLRALGVGDDIDLPTVAVVGDQSSGKSSVLEAISGVPLPRGVEIVTRCPLEMRMKKSDSPWSAEISFREKNSTQPTKWEVKSPTEVSKLIEEATVKLAGPNKDVSDDIISLSIRSPEAPDLTLVDLPGIVHSTEGNQSKEVITCVQNLLNKYMAKENTIILCVFPANMEVANCAVFSMANAHDQQGKRTMAIITKPDLVTENEQKSRVIQRMTEGGVYNVRSFHIVKGRSPVELRKAISREELLRREERFFEKDDLYRTVDESSRGFPSLMRALTYRLVKHIKECLPGMRTSLKTMLRQTQDAYNKLPPELPKKDADRKAFLTTSFMKFIREVESALERGQERCLWEREVGVTDGEGVGGGKGKGRGPFGTLSNSSAPISVAASTLPAISPPNKAHNFSTMFAVWRRSFDKFLNKLVSHTKSKLESNGDWDQQKLLTYLQRNRGDELPTFPSFSSFKKLVSDHLKCYETYSEDCVEEIYEDLLKFITFYTNQHFSEHRSLCDEVMEMAFNTAEKCLANTKEKIEFSFKKEHLGYCQDMTFLRLTKQEDELKASNNKTPNGTYTCTFAGVASVSKTTETHSDFLDRSQIAKQFQENLRIYFITANQRLGDDIPNTIRVGLHCEFASSFTERLLHSIENPEMQRALEQEDVHKHERTRLSKKLDRLKSAHELLENFIRGNGTSAD